MSDQRNGGIEWTDQTWNPLRGCSRVSEGCRHCYAEAMAARKGEWGTLSLDGQFAPTATPWKDMSEVAMVRVGKKTAGRLLDGVTHDGYPAVTP